MADLNDHTATVDELSQENAALKDRLVEYKEVEEDILSYKIFVNARKQMLAWVSIVGVALSIFGYASVNTLLDKSKEKIDVVIEEKVEIIAREVSSEVKSKLSLVTDIQISEMLEKQLKDRVNSIFDDRSKEIIGNVDEKLLDQASKISLINDEINSLRSEKGDTPTTITFINATPDEVEVFWKSYTGKDVKYKSLRSGGRYTQETFVTHPWVVKRQSDGSEIIIVTAEAGNKEVKIE